MKFLSFVKMHVKVWKKLVKIQRRIILREKGESKIYVNRVDVFKPKKLGILGVRDFGKLELQINGGGREMGRGELDIGSQVDDFSLTVS